MKKYLAKAEQFIDDHGDAVVAGIAGLTVGATVMLVVAYKAVYDVRAVGAFAKINEDTLTVFTVLNNGNHETFTWPTIKK